MSASHCCGYLTDRGRPCRRHVAGHRLRCPHHAFTKLQSEGRAIRPSALDTYDQCPSRFFNHYIARDVRDTAGLPARIGTAVHDALAAGLVAHALGNDWRPSIWSRIGQHLETGIPDGDLHDIERMLTLWRPPCESSQVLLVEPAWRHGSDAEPSTEWQPVRLLDGTEVWGTPDLIYRDDEGGIVIYDHKTGRAPSRPDGWAPWIYATILEAWAERAGVDLRWPVRVVWRFIRMGDDLGTRELLIYRDALTLRTHRLMGRMSRIRAAIRSGDWPCTPNEWCAYCPLWTDCPAMAPDEPKTASEMAGAYLAAVAERKRCEAKERDIRARLDTMVGVGDEIPHPQTGEPMFRVERKRSLRAKPLTPDMLRAVQQIAGEHGRDVTSLMRLSTSGLDGMADELVEAGAFAATDTVEIRRTSRD